ncbi:VOC family protein [Streptomyces endophyticus]|uniref:VOC family protein n=1 Tax=Streptomyces endophyticus TaxID=714166 RepID=A0ABU6F226_9ACTN|nr:VOC family protein [Streptomyces endophyticus]MEB8337909.1 VOC family protein [Streptomyces endophyticus]
MATDENETHTHIRRAVPNVEVSGEGSMTANRDFYGALGFREAMNMGWIMTMVSPSAPTAQIQFFTHEATAPVVPDISVEVDDVDAVYAAMRSAGAEIVHDLRDEEWGVRRFFVRDPQGKVVNVLTHAR